ncbi:IcmF-related protein [Klebsiella aerogenes]|nr:IcmF-related protein [Klebsiella aerogenes]
MGELNRALSLPQGNENDNWDSVSKEAPIPGAKGQSYFIKNLLQNVIFQEAGIAGQNRWWNCVTARRSGQAMRRSRRC